MTLPESAYRSGVLCVEPDEELEAREAVQGYHAGRSVCVAKKQEMAVIWYIMLALAGLDLFMQIMGLLGSPGLQHLLIVVCFAAAVVLILVNRKSMIPAAAAAVLGAVTELDFFWVLLTAAIFGAMAWRYEVDHRFIRSNPGYPEFHMIDLRVLRPDITEREIPPPSAERQAEPEGLAALDQ